MGSTVQYIMTYALLVPSTIEQQNAEGNKKCKDNKMESDEQKSANDFSD